LNHGCMPYILTSFILLKGGLFPHHNYTAFL
jgi:hypothetical protein